MARYLFKGVPETLYIIVIEQTRTEDDPDPERVAKWPEHLKAGSVSTSVYGPYGIKSRAKQEYNKHVKEMARYDNSIYDTVVRFLETTTEWSEIQ